MSLENYSKRRREDEILVQLLQRNVATSTSLKCIVYFLLAPFYLDFTRSDPAIRTFIHDFVRSLGFSQLWYCDTLLFDFVICATFSSPSFENPYGIYSFILVTSISSLEKWQMNNILQDTEQNILQILFPCLCGELISNKRAIVPSFCSRPC